LNEHAEMDCSVSTIPIRDDSLTIAHSRAHGSEPKPIILGSDNFTKEVCRLAKVDPLLSKIIDNQKDHLQFNIVDGMVYSRN
jgi:hypothetical protein